MKELLSQQATWNEQTQRVNEAIAKGELPLIFAASGLRTTLVELILGNLIRNATLVDSRKRSAIPLFSGRRKPTRLEKVSRLAIDPSALMVLAWLGLLPKVMQTYNEVVLPAGALQELFNGYSRIRQFQKSRIERARDVHRAIARGLKVHHAPEAIQDPLAQEIGVELASLLSAAKVAKGFVLRPAPVRRVDLEGNGNADLSAFMDTLIDMRSLLSTLSEWGAIDGATEETARRYFEVQDVGWPSISTPKRESPLYLDSLAVVYLQSVNLLDTVLNSFTDVFIDSRTEGEASALIEFSQNSGEVTRVIDEARQAVQKACESNRVIFGPLHKVSPEENDEQTDDDSELRSSSLNLVADLVKADAVVFDDRAFNKELFVVDNQGHRAHLVSSLDVIEELTARGVVKDSERQILRHRLRTAGSVLVPIDTEEILSAALKTRKNESLEFRAIRESIGLARIASVLHFPADIHWYGSLSAAVQHALIQIWSREVDSEKAERIADMILELRPCPDEWIACWDGHPPPDWSRSVRTVMTAHLALPIELKEDRSTETYNKWLEHRVLTPLRDTAPEFYQRVAEYLRTFILDETNEENEAG